MGRISRRYAVDLAQNRGELRKAHRAGNTHPTCAYRLHRAGIMGVIDGIERERILTIILRQKL